MRTTVAFNKIIIVYEEKKERVQFAKKLFQENLEIKTLLFLENKKETLNDLMAGKLEKLLKENFEQEISEQCKGYSTKS